MDQVNTQLRKEQEAFADARQIMEDFTKFLHNGGLDVVGANSYDRQQCYDKYESLEVMLKARQNELYHRVMERRTAIGGPLLGSVELNLTILHDIILNAVYYMVPNSETRRVKNSGKINLLYSRDASALYDARYHNQNIPQWLKLLPQRLFEPYDHVVTPLSHMTGIPSVQETYKSPPQPKRHLPLSEPMPEQNYIRQPSQDLEEKKVQIPRKTPNDFRYLSHRNRSAYYCTTANGGKLQSIKWFSFWGCGRRASGYS